MESSTALLKTSWWVVLTTGASSVMPGDVSSKSMNSRQEAPGSRSAKFPFLLTRFAMLFLIPPFWLLGTLIVVSRWSILAFSGAKAATLACRVGSDPAYQPRPAIGAKSSVLLDLLEGFCLPFAVQEFGKFRRNHPRSVRSPSHPIRTRKSSRNV